MDVLDNAAVAMAHARRHERVVLRAFPALAEARRLYEAAGFVRFGDEPVYMGCGAPIVDRDFERQRATERSGTIRP